MKGVRQVTRVGQRSVYVCPRGSVARMERRGFGVKEKLAGYGKRATRKKG